MDMFKKEKEDFLHKKDKSKKGEIDKDVIPLVNFINSLDDFYTTSSCAGRIVLLEMKSNKKNECEWLISRHSKIKFSEIMNALKNSKSKNVVWFKQQPIIMHIACRNLESALKILNLARQVFKRCGIITVTSKKVMVEIIGSENMDTIVNDSSFTADEAYLKKIVFYANKNFEINKKKTQKLFYFLKSI